MLPVSCPEAVWQVHVVGTPLAEPSRNVYGEGVVVVGGFLMNPSFSVLPPLPLSLSCLVSVL